MSWLQGGGLAHRATPVRAPYRRQKPDVCAGYALTSESSALHTPIGSPWCLEGLGIYNVARCHASMAVNPPHVVTRFNGRLRAEKSAVRALYAANAGPRASHSENMHARCMDSRDIDGGARWDACPVVKVPPQGSRANPLRWALEGGEIGRACVLRCKCRTPSLPQLACACKMYG